jgi:hypothetical protein
MDGFEMWRTFSANGIKGIIRADECFGSPSFSSEFEVREFIGATKFSDYNNGFWRNGSGSLQELPVALKRSHNESLDTWRDRMYAEYLFPYGIAALNDLKVPYVEIMTPFISRPIVEWVRKLPDCLRNGKTLFKEIVEARSPALPFARYPAIDLDRTFLRNQRVREYLLSELDSSHYASILPSTMIELIKATMQSRPGGHSPGHHLFKKMKFIIPESIIPLLKKVFPFRRCLDPFDLGLRLFIAVKMNEFLAADAVAWQREEFLRDYGTSRGIEPKITQNVIYPGKSAPRYAFNEGSCRVLATRRRDPTE